jgi:hypothetical protein
VEFAGGETYSNESLHSRRELPVPKKHIFCLHHQPKSHNLKPGCVEWRSPQSEQEALKCRVKRTASCIASRQGPANNQTLELQHSNHCTRHWSRCSHHFSTPHRCSPKFSPPSFPVARTMNPFRHGEHILYPVQANGEPGTHLLAFFETMYCCQNHGFRVSPLQSKLGLLIRFGTSKLVPKKLESMSAVYVRSGFLPEHSYSVSART